MALASELERHIFYRFLLCKNVAFVLPKKLFVRREIRIAGTPGLFFAYQIGKYRVFGNWKFNRSSTKSRTNCRFLTLVDLFSHLQKTYWQRITQKCAPRKSAASISVLSSCSENFRQSSKPPAVKILSHANYPSR